MREREREREKLKFDTTPIREMSVLNFGVKAIYRSFDRFSDKRISASMTRLSFFAMMSFNPILSLFGLINSDCHHST